MGIPCDREGTFRAIITGYGLRDGASGSHSIGVMLQAKLTELWNEDGWAPWEEYGMEADGTLWVIKADGTPNENAVRSLVEYAGWDGSGFDSISNNTWRPIPCQVVIKRDDYKGQARFRIEFVNDYNRTPGVMPTVAPEKVAALSARHGPALRAIAGNAKRNGTAPPAGKPASPPAPVAASRPAPPPPVAVSDDIPF